MFICQKCLTHSEKGEKPHRVIATIRNVIYRYGRDVAKEGFEIVSEIEICSACVENFPTTPEVVDSKELELPPLKRKRRNYKKR